MLPPKRPAPHPPIMLNEINRPRNLTAVERPFPHARHRKPRALNRKNHRDDVPDRIAHHRIRHHRPVSLPLPPVIQNSAQHPPSPRPKPGAPPPIPRVAPKNPASPSYASETAKACAAPCVSIARVF